MITSNFTTNQKEEQLMINILKALSLGTYVIAWLERASKDGEISQEEILEVIQGAVATVGLKVSIKTPPMTTGASI